MYGKALQNGKVMVRKAGAVILAVAILFSLSSCNIVQRIQKRFDNRSEDISKQELARLVSSAIMDKNNVADSYSSIPERQLDGMSYSIFYQYCDILRDMSSRHGNITAFRFLTAEETAKFFSDSDEKAGENAVSMKSYAGLTLVELIYEEDYDKTNPCRFALQFKNGGYTLANDYATKAVEAYDYISHYFKMISDGNTAGLESIIKPMLTDDIYISSVVTSKASYLIDYYKLHVKSPVREYKLKTFLPFTGKRQTASHPPPFVIRQRDVPAAGQFCAQPCAFAVFRQKTDSRRACQKFWVYAVGQRICFRKPDNISLLRQNVPFTGFREQSG